MSLTVNDLKYYILESRETKKENGNLHSGGTS